MKKQIEIYRHRVPNHYTHTFGITIHSKDSEVNHLEYDLMCVLYDAIQNHAQFKDVVILDKRDGSF